MRVILAVVLAAVLGACSKNARNYHDPAMDMAAVRTVAVMPLVNLSAQAIAGERVRDVISNALLSTGSIYVIPQGEVARVVARIGIQNPASMSEEEVVRLGSMIKADGVITGTLREYGEVRSASAASNVVSLSLQLSETAKGKVVWSGSTTKGGIGFGDRLIGSGGAPLNDMTEKAVDDLIDKLFR